MQAKELRCGNYVDWNGEKGIISQILEKEVAFKCGEDTLLTYIQPIPLTEEWLLRFGFVNSILGYYTKHAGNNVMSVYVFNERCAIELGTLRICSINFVHQLQNLFFALNGEELTLKNGTKLTITNNE